ncbi:MAG: transcription antitermination factor NusB [Deinococcales bacterium]
MCSASNLGESYSEGYGDNYGESYGDSLDRASLSFAESLLKSYDQNREAINKQLSESLKGWTFGQMAQTDVAILRLALTEMLYTDVPKEVTIEMAVRIAKKYGGDESGRFVNGVLASIYRGMAAS